MFDILAHLKSRIDIGSKPILCILDSAIDRSARPFFAAESIAQFANIIFIGNRSQIRANALSSEACSAYSKRANISPESYVEQVLDKVTVIDHLSPTFESVREAYAQHCYAKLSKKHLHDISYYREWVKSPQAFGVLSAVDVDGVGRHSHCVFGGLASSSRDFFMPCLRLHPRCDTVFTAALFSFPPNCRPPIYNSDVLVLADIAVVLDMTPMRLANVTLETSLLACDVLHPFPLDTINTAMLSYSTRGSGAGASVDMIREAYKIIESKIKSSSDGAYQHINITPELQFAPSVLESAAREKVDPYNPENAAAGRANVLISPNLETGNVLFHLHVAYFPAASHVLLPGGFTNHSAVDFSRSSKVDDIITAAAAACVRIQKLKNFSPVLPTYSEEMIWET